MNIPTDIKLIHPSEAFISQKFGENKVDFYKNLGMSGHNGIDYACASGSTVICPMDMTITFLTKNDAGYGTSIWGRSKSFDYNGQIYALEAVLGHLDSYQVELGQEIKKGSKIAKSDNTGKYTTGPHLHFGVRYLKQQNGGWYAQFKDNGFLGYFDPMPLIDLKENLMPYDGKIVYGQGQNQIGARHYYVKDGEFYWIEDEVAFCCGDFLFEEAVPIGIGLFPESIKTYKIDYDKKQTKVVKQLLGLLKDNPKRAKQLFTKYF